MRGTKWKLSFGKNYNGHYKIHGIMSQLLIDYESNFVSFVTNLDGTIHDSLSAIKNSEFKRIIDNNLVVIQVIAKLDI